MITIRGLKKSFGTQVVLDRVDLEIESGQTTAVVGPSGTGKSVLLKIITGLLPADGGDVLVNGESMTMAKRGRDRRRICERMGVLFQAAALFDSLTIFENVAFPLRARGILSESEIHRKTLERLDEVGLLKYMRYYPGEVPMGVRKRTGIARALVTDPETILFDEPNTGLDPEVGQEIYDLIRQTQARSGFTGIVISHEIPEVFQICDRVAMLYGGRIQAEGSVDEFIRSANPIVHQFVRGDIEGPIRLS